MGFIILGIFTEWARKIRRKKRQKEGERKSIKTEYGKITYHRSQNALQRAGVEAVHLQLACLLYGIATY